jgi:3-oxoacyl-[acyl-carrier protein] reductase
VSLYSGKVVVVTGTSRGLGKMIASHFLAQGANVIGLSRSPSDLSGGRYLHETVDITDAKAVQNALAGLDHLDILINNAGLGPSSYAVLQDPDEALSAILTNFYGTFLVSRAAARIMIKTGGRIVNIGSILAAIEPVGASIYASTKAAIETFSAVLAKEMARRGITVNTLGMASIESEMFSALGEQGQKYVDALPIPRLAEPDDVYNVIDFFCSPRSSFVTGQVVYLGGVR